MFDYAGKWSLITGASAGLGVAFARQLAAAGSHCLLVARREDRLRDLSERLRQDHGVECDVLPLDLTERDAPARLFEQTEQADRPIDVLINNAGFGGHGNLLEAEVDRTLNMIDLNVTALTHLSMLFGRAMAARHTGRICQVASVAGYQPTPGNAVYGASKAFARNLGIAMQAELRGTGVACTTLCPGYVDTEFFDAAGVERSWLNRKTAMTADDVVRPTLRALAKGRPLVMPGLHNRIMVFVARWLPITWVARLAGRLQDD